jgi:hypothetical protein
MELNWKNLTRVIILILAVIGAETFPAFAEEVKRNDNKSISFEEAAKMEQMSEKDKLQKGAGTGSFYVFIRPTWYFSLNNIWLPYF